MLVKNMEVQGSGIQGDEHEPAKTEYYAVEVPTPASD